MYPPIYAAAAGMEEYPEAKIPLFVPAEAAPAQAAAPKAAAGPPGDDGGDGAGGGAGNAANPGMILNLPPNFTSFTSSAAHIHRRRRIFGWH